MLELTALEETRFFDKFIKEGPDDCWEWLGAVNGDGYGTFHFNGKKQLAHRVAYFLHTNQWPGILFVCHHCDNPSCVNHNHLFLGTGTDNQLDRFSKDRGGPYHLTIKQRRDIQYRYGQGGISRQTLACQFGVNYNTVWRITTGRVKTI